MLDRISCRKCFTDGCAQRCPWQADTEATDAHENRGDVHVFVPMHMPHIWMHTGGEGTAA